MSTCDMDVQAQSLWCARVRTNLFVGDYQGRG